jgi:hypothetical protein
MAEENRIQLGIIFDKDKGTGKYSDDALLYQKILKFSLLGTNYRTFSRWAICKWLKNNHLPFEKRSVVSLQNLVERKIKILLELKLIHEIGSQKISTGTGETTLYTFDVPSYLLGRLIESSCGNANKRNRAIEKVFNTLFFMLTDPPVSMNIFLKSLIRKFRENGPFEYLAMHMIELLESDHFIPDISELINQTLIFRSASPVVVNKYNRLWEGTLNELDPHLKELVMFRIKLLYENRMKLSAHDVAQFEQARFDARERFDKLVLECGCLSCLCIRYEMIDLIEYIAKLRHHFEGYSALKMDCPSCNKKDSVQIIDL